MRELDLLAFDRTMREHRLLDAATQKQLYTPVRLSSGRTEGYGLGLALSDHRGHTVVHHAGGIHGFSAFYGAYARMTPR